MLWYKDERLGERERDSESRSIYSLGKNHFRKRVYFFLLGQKPLCNSDEQNDTIISESRCLIIISHSIDKRHYFLIAYDKYDASSFN